MPPNLDDREKGDIGWELMFRMMQSKQCRDGMKEEDRILLERCPQLAVGRKLVHQRYHKDGFHWRYRETMGRPLWARIIPIIRYGIADWIWKLKWRRYVLAGQKTKGEI